MTDADLMAYSDASQHVLQQVIDCVAQASIESGFKTHPRIRQAKVQPLEKVHDALRQTKAQHAASRDSRVAFTCVSRPSFCYQQIHMTSVQSG